ncbi:MAG: hypothetical protein HY877_05635, partial [Deltaproteobacteria bacterium]|nr:hypothetical protein [Deltaproteobacteria bacterium]
KKAWLGKDHVTNVSVPLAVDAHNVKQGVKIDLSRVYRISDGSKGVPYGTTAGFSVIGSNFKDNIIASEGDDIIAGLAGDDTLSGQAGKDQIYGGGWKELMDSLGLKIADDGNDTIDGGIGKDTIDGGGGFNTGFKTDETIGANAEYQTNILNRIDGHNTTPLESSWLGSDTYGWESKEVKSGEVELTETYDINDSRPNVLSLKMPDGYDMAFAEETTDGSLKITMVGKDERTGAPKTFTITVKRAFSSRTGPSASLNSPFTLKFDGNGKDNIIDFHSVDFKNNLLKISGLAGDDMILAPTNDLVQENITLDNLTGTQNRISRRELQDKKDDFIPDHDKTDPNEYGYGIRATIGNANEIVIEKTVAGTDERKVFIDPTDYDKAYVMQDPKNSADLLVVLVKRGAAGSPPTTVVIRIKDYEKFSASAETNKKANLSWLTIGKKNRTATAGEDDSAGTAPEAFTPFTNVVPLIHAKLNSDNKPDSGTVIDAGEGDNDFVFHAKEDQVTGQETDVEGHYTAGASDPARVPPNTSGDGSGSDTH